MRYMNRARHQVTSIGGPASPNPEYGINSGWNRQTRHKWTRHSELESSFYVAGVKDVTQVAARRRFPMKFCVPVLKPMEVRKDLKKSCERRLKQALEISERSSQRGLRINPICGSKHGTNGALKQLKQGQNIIQIGLQNCAHLGLDQIQTRPRLASSQPS